MRNPWQGDDARRARRSRGRSDPVPSTASSSSPYDFGSADDENVDPVDLLAIRADDELLDALASGRSGFADIDSRLPAGFDTQLDAGIHDDRQMMAMLQSWRADVDSEPIPELVSVDQASEAIVAGYRTARPRRWLMPVAAAAAVVVFGLSGVALGAGNAMPGDALWGVSTVLNADRAQSVEASQRVDVALSSARKALSEGRVADAKVALASVAPELSKVTDEQTKDELERRSANLADAAGQADEGEQVQTDESGKRDDPEPGQQDPGSSEGGSNPGSGSSPDPRRGEQSGSGGEGSQPSRPDPRMAGTPPQDSTKPQPSSEPKPQPKPQPQIQQPKPQPTAQPRPEPKPKPSDEPKPKPKPGPQGEGEGEPDPDTEQNPPPGPQKPQPSS